MRRLARDDPDAEVAEAVVQRISLPGRQIDRADAGLERRGVAEVKAREQREVITGERDQADASRYQKGTKMRSRKSFVPSCLRGQPFSEPGSGGVERGASLVSIG